MTETISIDTQRARAAKFAKEFENVKSEKQNDQDFMRGFCEIFGISSKSIEWQYDVRENKKSAKKWIDGLIPNTLLMEIKSADLDLDKAYKQAADYVPMIKETHRPDYILVSDFANLHLYNRITGAPRVEIKLCDLPQKIDHFQFLAGYEQLAIENQQKINEKAAEKMADLHDEIKKTGYDGKDLENYLVRLLFCLFAEDTGLFGENGAFLNYLHNHTKIDGSDLHGALTLLFDTLNTEPKKRAKNLPEHLAKFPYINGALFQGGLSPCYFDEATRNTLIECANLDWSDISPAIFGSLFQAVMHDEEDTGKAKTKKRREFGAHYTSDANIIKTINPLFMDDLRAEFDKCSKQKLPAFHEKLAKLNFFDPACGCGNFLIVAYRELRLLEIEVIKKIYGDKLKEQIDVGETLILCNVHQFHGIDIDDSATHIATVAMWLVDHQMNLEVGKAFGNYFNRIPLVKKANIVHANALQLDWQSVIKPKDCSFIMGNPPFIGAKMMNDSQRADIAPIFGKLKNGGLLDYVAAWHVTATEYIKQNPKIAAAFVSTNSICQGEQVGVLWSYLLAQGVKIRFAYRTFKWSNEGRGVAAVHCIIVGFGLNEPEQRFIFNDEVKTEAKNINPYLTDAPNVLLENRSKPLCNVPKIGIGNKPIDGGNYLFTTEEKAEFIAKEPASESFFKRWLGADEFLNGYERWCLWLGDIAPNELTKMPLSLARIAAVKQFRESSKSEPTRKIAATPTRFHVEFMPQNRYLVVPKVSSENRLFIPIGFIEPETLSSDLLFIVANAELYNFGVLSSSFHNAWNRTVCGRLGNGYRYSAGIVYNNFPFPTPNAKQIATIEKQAQAVLDARSVHENSTLADLYNPLTMPANLVKAHNELDKAVDAAYNFTGKKDDAARVAFLFLLYQKLSAPAIEPEKKEKKQLKH